MRSGGTGLRPDICRPREFSSQAVRRSRSRRTVSDKLSIKLSTRCARNDWRSKSAVGCDWPRSRPASASTGLHKPEQPAVRPRTHGYAFQPCQDRTRHTQGWGPCVERKSGLTVPRPYAAHSASETAGLFAPARSALRGDRSSGSVPITESRKLAHPLHFLRHPQLILVGPLVRGAEAGRSRA
jgi:hypothetical protein